MKSNNEILIDNLVLLEHCIHFQMKRYSTPLEFKQELFQTLSLIILEYDNTKLNNIVFWGAGKIGKQALEIWEFAGISPRFFIDNSTEIQRKSFHGVEIISYEQFKDSEFHGTIYITIAQYDDVLSLLQDDNLDRIEVKIMNSMSLIVKEIL